jgi:hypothetical protein
MIGAVIAFICGIGVICGLSLGRAVVTALR